ncbi:polysaccharide biosynthesis protein [Palleronia aestuarii]|uniref:Polysaccharide biosynthesis protein n=1 Tax=Palleronia aestuarii TaxID=568105 RepID=A0A2W7PXS5_9RHOB|nr:polysaccharide biosynthesis protein [Palleronia aestuarii]PZX14349.1 polysaccharide biosynthesis protein [Palleronia aestuarii]
MPDHETYFSGRRIIVTGGVGSVGREIVKRLLALDVARIRVIDNNESGLFEMETAYRGEGRVEFFHCDICDEREMSRTFSNMDACFHAAALKHVPSCERSPFSAVNVNILGCEIVGRAALANGLDKVIFTSSDKAVNPTNVMGTSKLMGERLFTAMNFLRRSESTTKFACTRFGNVLGSNGSVVPLFAQQIASGGPVTLTDERMTRFVMTNAQAADLVIESMALALGGEVFITKMPVLRIPDLAREMRALLAPLADRTPEEIEIAVTGPRPGEKLWEELSTEEESTRILEGDRFLAVLPAGMTREERQGYSYPGIGMEPSTAIYHSDRLAPMGAAGIRELLLSPGVLPDAIRARLEARDDTAWTTGTSNTLRRVRPVAARQLATG